MIELGQTVGNYRIVSRLGEGGMGAVFLAEHPVIGRKAALKVIHPQHAQNLEVISRFVNEATAISRIGHEHIVDVTDLGRTPTGDFYFFMEYLDGRPLSELLALEAPLPPPRALAIAAQIADALAASHAHGIIHRDLKPENVFLISRRGDAHFVKVLDFGLAMLVRPEEVARRDTRVGVVMGTPFYMSPEQCRAEGVIDHRADVYSLGVVLFEMLTGKVPFGGDAFGEVLLKQVTMRPPSARSLVPGLPEALDLLLDRALAKDPADRFPSMTAFREALFAPAAPPADPPAPIAHVAAERRDRTRDARPMSRAELARQGDATMLVPAAPARRTVAKRSPPSPFMPVLEHAPPGDPIFDPPVEVTFDPSADPFFDGSPALLDDRSLDRVPRHSVGRTVALVGAAIAGVVLAAFLTRDDPTRATAQAAEPAPVTAPSTIMLARQPGAAPSTMVLVRQPAAAGPSFSDRPPAGRAVAGPHRHPDEASDGVARSRGHHRGGDEDGILTPSFVK